MTDFTRPLECASSKATPTKVKYYLKVTDCHLEGGVAKGYHRGKEHHHQSSFSVLDDSLAIENWKKGTTTTADVASSPVQQQERGISSKRSTRKENAGSAEKKQNQLISETEKCRVCQAPATKHIHYGATTCFSCRAFFRRSVKSDSGASYLCRWENDCLICPVSRRNCQKCRFEKCLAIGMKPGWVLKDEELAVRFKKYRQKNVLTRHQKETEPKQTVAEMSIGMAPEGGHEENYIQVSGSHSEKERPLALVKKSVNSEDQEYFRIKLAAGRMTGSGYGMLERIGEDEIAVIRDVSRRHDYYYTSVSFGEEVIKEMVMSSVSGESMSPVIAMTAYRLMIQRVTRVAQNFEDFIGLPFRVQSTLLKYNSDMVVSLRGAVFFEMKKQGLDQILIALGVDDMDTAKTMISSTLNANRIMGRIVYNNFNSIQVQTVTQEEARYGELLARVGSTVSFNLDLVKLLSLILLFSTDFEDDHIDPQARENILRLQNIMSNMLQRYLVALYPFPMASTLYSSIIACLGDLRELTEIKRRRQLAAAS